MEKKRGKMIDHRASMTKAEIDFLKSIVGKNKLIVEIGSYVGKTTRELAKSNIVVAVDPFISGYDPRELHMMNMDGVEKMFRANIKGKNVIWFKEKSEEVLGRWNIAIDGVFIDSEHTTKALTIDCGWIKYVKPGGILAFHDYGFHPDVTSLVSKEIIPKYREIGRERFLIIFRKQ